VGEYLKDQKAKSECGNANQHITVYGVLVIGIIKVNDGRGEADGKGN
jgi:hypothetical protein